VLCVELTTLTLLTDDQSRRNFVACALFGDGAAAALIGSAGGDRPALARLGRGSTHLFPGSRDLMGWDVRKGGWQVVFSPRIPAVVRKHIAPLVDACVDREQVVHWVLHPGGRRVLESYRDALGLDAAALEPASAVLARYGNMSAVTVLFVLDHILRRADFRPGPAVLTAFGPGFTAEVCALEVVNTNTGVQTPVVASAWR
jgi:alkylresorcinol/alkylpyrone synthase